MKDCIIVTSKLIRLGQTPNGRRNTYHYLFADMRNNSFPVWNKEHIRSAPCIWVSTYDRRCELQYVHSTTYEETYDDEGVLTIRSLKDIPDDYYEMMSVPVMFGHYKWNDIDYVKTAKPRKDGVPIFTRYYVKRRKKL